MFGWNWVKLIGGIGACLSVAFGEPCITLLGGINTGSAYVTSSCGSNFGSPSLLLQNKISYYCVFSLSRIPNVVRSVEKTKYKHNNIEQNHIIISRHSVYTLHVYLIINKVQNYYIEHKWDTILQHPTL